MACLRPRKHFLRIQIEFEKSQRIEVDARMCKLMLMAAVRSLFGQCGSAGCTIDVISFEELSRVAVVCVDSEYVVRFWNALTLMSEYDGRRCCVRVLQTAPFSTSLAFSSRLAF
eukprot:GILJ01010441.1.p1 GENE.GILJ01010441.1~~GILJ01010441.1.p1  ORF type:complete len:129 (-),score=2.22 GILJ01010441.1:213-554(-)